MARKSNSSLVTVSFNLTSTVAVHCKRIAAVAAAAAVGFVAFAVGKWKTTCRVLLASLLVLPCSHFFLLHSLPLPLRLSPGSLRPYHHREPVRLPFWLLAIFVDGLAPSACVVRCPRIHHAFRHHVMCLFDTLFSSCIGFLLCFPPWPQLLCLLVAPPELFLLSPDFVARPEHSLLLLFFDRWNEEGKAVRKKEVQQDELINLFKLCCSEMWQTTR